MTTELSRLSVTAMKGLESSRTVRFSRVSA
jgi:hypothetical protein